MRYTVFCVYSIGLTGRVRLVAVVSVPPNISDRAADRVYMYLLRMVRRRALAHVTRDGHASLTGGRTVPPFVHYRAA